MEKGSSALRSPRSRRKVFCPERIERSEVGSPGEFDHLTDDELERALIERLAQLGFAPVAISNGSIALNGADTDKTEGS